MSEEDVSLQSPETGSGVMGDPDTLDLSKREMEKLTRW